MKMTLKKHGGLAAGVHQPPCVVEFSTLAAQQQEELSRLVAELRVTPAVTHERLGNMRDAMAFEITIDDNNMCTVYRQADLQMSEAFGNLLTWIEKHSAASRIYSGETP